MSVEDQRDLAALVEGAAALGLTLDAEQVERFARYRELLLDWNSRINLTAITDPEEVVTRHFLDSLTCAPLLQSITPSRATPRLLDVGAGAGFPGLPLAIALPNWDVTLLEATGKKVRFLEAVIAELGLTNAHALAGRAEEVAHNPAYRARFDAVTARAVASLPTLLEYCAPFARVGATLIFPKKGELSDEIAAGQRAAALLGARLLDPIPVTLPALADGRMLLVARQERPCSPQYPRPAGAPVKRPLGA
ncbi:MAG TPA: 16S rRNA (guanine(527)-N(7))-methyltransferase RsmG [Ktedonobacterales bacterium]